MKDYEVNFDKKNRLLYIIFNKKPRNFLKYEKEFISLYNKYKPESFIINYKLKNKLEKIFHLDYIPSSEDRKKIIFFDDNFYYKNLIKEIINKDEYFNWIKDLDFKEIDKIIKLQSEIYKNYYFGLISNKKEAIIKFGNDNIVFYRNITKDYPYIYNVRLGTKTEIKNFIDTFDKIVKNLKNIQIKVILKNIINDFQIIQKSKNIFYRFIEKNDPIIDMFREKILDFIINNGKIGIYYDGQRDEKFLIEPLEKTTPIFSKITKGNIFLFSNNRIYLNYNVENYVFGVYTSREKFMNYINKISKAIKNFKIKEDINEIEIKRPPNIYIIRKVNDYWKIFERIVRLNQANELEEIEEELNYPLVLNSKLTFQNEKIPDYLGKSMILMLFNNGKNLVMNLC